MSLRDPGSPTALRIAPSILAADFASLGAALHQLDAVTDWVHLDVMDGHFVPNLTLGPALVASLRPHSDHLFDCHLMVTDPRRHLEAFAHAGADSCTVHVEAHEAAAALADARALGLRVGLALNPDTPAAAVLDHLGDVDVILVMSVFPGFAGQAFIPEVLTKVRDLREEIDAHAPRVDLEIDGGIDQDTAGGAVAAGARVLVAGSAIFRAADPLDAARELRHRARSA